MKLPEQIDKSEWSQHYKKWLKRQVSRWRRRLGKRLLNDAPKKNKYKGYSL